MMKNNLQAKFSMFLFLICLLFFTAICNADCIWINRGKGLVGYELTLLSIDIENPNTVYVGSKGFLLKTIDGGENWKKIFKVPGINKQVNFIAIDSKNTKIIFIATEAGIFKSEDGGEKWLALSLGPLGTKKSVLSLLIDSEDGKTVLAGTEKDILMTNDAGKNWIKSSEGLTATNIRSIVQDPASSKILYAAAESGLFKSVDCAKTWEKVLSADSLDEDEDGKENSQEDEELPNYASWVSIDPFNISTVYFSAVRVVFRSDDGGNSWTRLTKAGLSNSHIKNLAISSSKKGFLFAVTEKGLFRFSEEENMWREFYSGLSSKETVFVALNDKENELWLATKNGLFKSKGDIYEIKEITVAEKTGALMQNFINEPSYREIQEAAIEYAEVHPDKIEKWRRAAKAKAWLPVLSFGIEKDSSKSLHWDAGVNPDTWVIGPEEEETGWDVSCAWNLGELIWNDDQTSIDVRSKLMVQLRDDILDEVTHLYFERRRLQVELLQSPPANLNEFINKKLRLQELTANIDAMTGGYLSREIEGRKSK